MTCLRRSMFWAIPALLMACEGTEEIAGANQATGGSTNEEIGGSMSGGAGGSMSGGAGGSTNAGAGGKGGCPPPDQMVSATFCFSDADCSGSSRCDMMSCFASSCSCSGGVMTCTSDCRHVCVEDAGGQGGDGAGEGGGASVSGAGGAGD
jgi:hypothetical protein